MSEYNQKTVRELINEISFSFDEADLYYGHGTDNAFDEAVYLVFGTLDIPFDTDDQALNEIVADPDYQEIIQRAQHRIKEKVPVAYLVNKAWFCGLPFYIDDRVLIPRSPFAELIENGFSPWVSNPEEIKRALDIGTGSGCIAIAVSLAFPSTIVDAIDNSEEALEIAKINIQQYQLADRVHLMNSDLFKNLPATQYDLILANPPYVDQVDMEQLPDEFRHEPVSGLAAGPDGLDLVRTIIVEAKDYLNDKGLLIVEVGNSRPALETAFPLLPFTWLEFDRGGEGVFLLYKEDL